MGKGSQSSGIEGAWDISLDSEVLAKSSVVCLGGGRTSHAAKANGEKAITATSAEKNVVASSRSSVCPPIQTIVHERPREHKLRTKSAS